MEKLKTSHDKGIQNALLRKEEFGINKILEEPPSSY